MRELETDLDARELRDWLAYYQVEPWDDIDPGSAQVCATLANLHRPKGHKGYGPTDFMARRPRPQATVGDQVLATFRRLAAAGPPNP